MIAAASGLPAYTLPPAGDDRADSPPPFGAQSASAPSARDFSAPAARPASAPPAPEFSAFGARPASTTPPADPAPYDTRPAAGSQPFGARPASAPPAGGSQPFGARPASAPPARPTVHNEPGASAHPLPSGGRPAYDEPALPVPGTYSPSAQTSAPAFTADAAAPMSAPTAPFGVGNSGATRQPFGGSTAPAGPAPAAPPTPSPATPQQRMHGTVYGGMGNDSPIDMTMPVSMNAVDNSGSLTGHILAQGWAQEPDTNRRSNTKVAVAMMVVLLALVGISLLFLFTALANANRLQRGVKQ